MANSLASWRDGEAKEAILCFVNRVCDESSGRAVPVEDRVAVFDNDGTLWCEKPMPIQLDFILRRLAAMAQAEESLRNRQPWKSAYEHDYGWLAAAVADHYAGDDTKAGVLAGGVVAGFGNISVEDFAAQSEKFLREARHPTLDRGYLECAYAPMIELLSFLEEQGFSNYIASGGGRDFMRPISAELYGIPSERVIGSSVGLVYTPDDHGGTVTREAATDYLDDGPQKPVRIWSRTGRRPLLAAGNSNGDIDMLRYTQHPDKPTLRLLIQHDDPDREFDYQSGAEKAMDQAATSGWTVVSINNDWATVF